MNWYYVLVGVIWIASLVIVGKLCHRRGVEYAVTMVNLATTGNYVGVADPGHCIHHVRLDKLCDECKVAGATGEPMDDKPAFRITEVKDTELHLEDL